MRFAVCDHARIIQKSHRDAAYAHFLPAANGCIQARCHCPLLRGGLAICQQFRNARAQCRGDDLQGAAEGLSRARERAAPEQG